MTENIPTTPDESLPRTRLALLVMVRTVLNVPFRIVYPFLPSIARGLGVSLAAANGLITLRWLVRMAVPLIGPLLDRYERRRVMEAAMLCFTLAGLLLAGFGTFTATAVA
ncbi:MAG: MFS transporter, partial [Delftia sp.]|nr:MFS transporter [Delftia sp.]